jgi:mono/diheme cytochrome c family protein
MRLRAVVPALLLPAALLAAPALGADVSAERGHYLVQLGGCNDCHTPGYPEADGKLPEGQWLTGNPVGFRGPWGTSYPANLRLAVRNFTEDQWLAWARAPKRPPMPWFNLRDMTDGDLRSVYRYIKQLGPKGAPAPHYVPPDQTPQTAYIDFVPKNLPQQAKSRTAK